MMELVIPLTAIALLFVVWALAAATAQTERRDAEPDYGDWQWPEKRTRR